jgi:hypothetical protein
MGVGCWGPQRFTVGFFCDICDSCGEFFIFYVAGVERLDLARVKHISSFM